MNAIGRKPVDPADIDLEILNHLVADIVPSQVASLLRRLIAHSANKARAALLLEREHGDEIGAIEGDMDLAVDHVAGSFHIGHVKGVLIGAAGKTDAERLANHGARAIAACDISGPAGLLRSVCLAETGVDRAWRGFEAEQLNTALDSDARAGELGGEQTFVLVLREDERKPEEAEVGAHALKGGVSRAPAAHPQVDRRHPAPGAGDSVRDAELAIKLKSPVLHGKRARGCFGL